MDHDGDLRQEHDARLVKLAQRCRREDGYLTVAAIAPMVGQQAVRALRDRNGWGVLAAAVTVAAAVARTELMARQMPAQLRAGAERVRHNREVVDGARARGEDPYAAANADARRLGVSLLSTCAAALVFVVGQLHRRRRGPDPQRIRPLTAE